MAGIPPVPLAVMQWALQARLRSHGVPADRATSGTLLRALPAHLPGVIITVSWALQADLAAMSLLQVRCRKLLKDPHPLLNRGVATVWWCHRVVRPTGTAPTVCSFCRWGQWQDAHLG